MGRWRAEFRVAQDSGGKGWGYDWEMTNEFIPWINKIQLKVAHLDGIFRYKNRLLPTIPDSLMFFASPL